MEQVKLICMFDLTKDKESREAFNWKNTQPLLKQYHQHKGIKYNFLDYLLQFIKVYQFLKKMKRDITKIFIDEIYNKPSKRNYETNKTSYNTF